jgi:Tol biopolymer transport system component
MNRFVVSTLVLAILAGGPIAPAGFAAGDATTVLVSQSTTGVAASDGGFEQSISNDGRYVVFTAANDLAAGDTNGYRDVYLRDMLLGTTTLVSLTRTGAQGSSHSTAPAISGNGRYVAFETASTNFERDFNGNARDIYVRNLQTGAIHRVNESAAGAQGDGESLAPVLGTSGRYVAFVSSSENLVAGDTNGRRDVFLRDRKLRTITRVSLTDAGHQNPGGGVGVTMSATGRYIGFTTDEPLVPADTNGTADAYVRDVTEGRTILVSVASGGQIGNNNSFPASRYSISANGRFVAFVSQADNLVPGDTNGSEDIFVRDLVQQTTARVNVSTAGEQDHGTLNYAAISGNGRHVVFASFGTELVPHDTNELMDVFDRDLVRSVTRRLSIPDTGGQAREGHSLDPVSSANGTCVAFQSSATNLDSGVTMPGYNDIYMRELTGSCP